MKTLSCILAFLLTGLLPLASGQDAEFISQVAAAQREATADYPDLARVGTPLNKRFVSEYTRLKKADDPILSGPDWPKKLARRCAEDLGIQPATPAATDPTPSTTGVHASAIHPIAGGSKATICGHVMQKVPEGLLVNCAEDADERRGIPGAPTSRFVIGAPLAKSLVLLVGNPAEKSMADDDPIANVIAVESGTYEYDTTGGSTKTVRVYRYVNGR